MSEDEQLAGSVKYAPSTLHFAEIRPGLFALWHHDFTFLCVTEDWNEVLNIYRTRPSLTPRKNLTRPLRNNIDISELEIRI